MVKYLKRKLEVTVFLWCVQEGQHKLESLTTHTMESLSIGHKDLLSEQEKLRTTQNSLKDFVALNLRQLTKEKAMIAAGQQELTKMADIVTKLGECYMFLKNHFCTNKTMVSIKIG